MRSQANELQNVGIDLAVDEHEIGAQVAVAMIFPGTDHWMVTVSVR